MLTMFDPPVWRTDGADWPHRAHSHFVRAGGCAWHVQRRAKLAIVAGGSDARVRPVALLLHGTGAASHSWAGLFDRLGADFDVINVDLPGHGFTRVGGAGIVTLPGAARSLGALLAELDASPALVVGHSAGAAIMAQMILDGVVEPRLAISLNGAFRPFDGAARYLFPVMAKVLFYNPASAFLFAQAARDERRVRRLLEQTGSAIGPEGADFYGRLLRRSGHVAGALSMMAHWDLASLERRLPGAGAPFLFVAGALDKAVPPGDAARIAGVVERGDHRLLEDLGHLAHEEAPDLVADLIRAAAREYGVFDAGDDDPACAG